MRNLPHPDVGVEELRSLGSDLDAQKASPRVAHEEHHGPARTAPGGRPSPRWHRRSVAKWSWCSAGVATEGHARPALLPPDHREVPFQPRGMRAFRKNSGMPGPPCRNRRTGFEGSVLWMIMPCRTPLISTNTRSERLPGIGRPASSRSGGGRPGLSMTSSPARLKSPTKVTSKIPVISRTAAPVSPGPPLDPVVPHQPTSIDLEANGFPRDGRARLPGCWACR
jgi:hypothetical protein